MAETLKCVSCSRLKWSLRREYYRQPVRHLVDGHAARNQPRAVFALHGFGFGKPFLRSKFTDDSFQDIGGCHDAFEVPVFIVNKSDVDRRILDDIQNVKSIDGVGDDRCPTDMAANVRAIPAQIRIQQVLGLYDSQYSIRFALVNRQPRMYALHNCPSDLIRAVR